MNLPDNILNVAGIVISTFLTLTIFSYLLGDNALFRLASHIFIGTTAALIIAIAWESVLWPKLLYPFLFGSSGERLATLMPLALGILLLSKLSPRFSALGTPVMAFLLGVGAAIAVGGAVVGTLVPQTLSSTRLIATGSLSKLNYENFMHVVQGLLIILGTVTALGYFHFGLHFRDTDRNRISLIRKTTFYVGGIFIAITLGVVYAGIYSAALVAMIDRLNFLMNLLH